MEEGQFVSLLGPSGCGKTTTLTIIAGFQKATDGVIKVNGAKVEKCVSYPYIVVKTERLTENVVFE